MHAPQRPRQHEPEIVAGIAQQFTLACKRCRQQSCLVHCEEKGGGMRQARTSERWPSSFCWKSSGARMSRCRMFRSRLPLLSRWLLQAMVPTRPRCPSIVRTLHACIPHPHLCDMESPMA